MASNLLTDSTWQAIIRLAEKTSSARVAVAYFGQGASRLLPLKAGSVLVVDLSKAAVRSGQTFPQEIAKLLRRGVEVHSCSNLHAKVFVFGRRALVGSANVSRNSEQSLLAPGQSVLLFQPRLEAELHGWLLRGDVDLLRLERSADGTLHILIGDMKSTTEVKVEHRLQVAFYRLMLERLFKDSGIAHMPIQTAILFRPPDLLRPA